MSAGQFTPGLRVTDCTLVRKDRRLPIAGEVLVETGARVRAEDVVAHAELPGDVATVNVVNLLGIVAGELPKLMLKKVGDPVRKDEVIAETQPFFKFLRSEARSPIDGTVETISQVTGQVIIRTAPKPVDVLAYLDGTIVEVYPKEGVAVEADAAFVQGIFGIGREVAGQIAVVGKGPADIIGPEALTPDLKGKIVVAGSLVTRAVYDQASKLGIAAVVCGGFHDADLRALLGYDLGVAITGHETVTPTLIITEGFGEIAIAARTYELLKSHAGLRASANGATQIRAGVQRPEIIIPLSTETAEARSKAQSGGTSNAGLTIGSTVRIIREPGFGRLGVVRGLPPEPRKVESEAKVRVAEIELSGGEKMTVPRTNVEVIGS